MSPRVGVAASFGLGRFKLLATAISGRLVEVAPVEPGALAWTDGATIFIDQHAGVNEQLCSLAVQASLLGAGSLNSDVLDRLVRRRSLVGRYLAVEGHRALAAHEALLPLSVRPLIDRSVIVRTESPAGSLAFATGRTSIDDPPRSFGTIRPRRIRAVVATNPDHEVTPQTLTRASQETVLRDLDDEDDEGAAVDILSSPVGGGGGIGRLLKKMLGDARSPGGAGPPGADAPTHWSRRAPRVAQAKAVIGAATPIPDGVDLIERRGTRYPEWDVYRRRYRPDWCTVVEVVPKAEELAPLTPPDTHALRRPLAHLGIDLERCRRQLQGDDIDIDAAVEAHVETIAGSPPDEALYVDTLRRQRDLAVLLLLDISGSAGETSPTGATVHEHQRAAAAALMVALYDLGDRVALYGFRSQGRSAVHVVPIKPFGDELDTRAMQRLGGLVPAGYTRLGAAVRHGAAVLDQDGGASRRLLVVLSDGFAYDHGYQGTYGEADARRALAEARRRGLGCLCVSVGADTDADALRRVFGTAAHARIPRVEQLPSIVGPLFRSALQSAEVRRRVAQRRLRTRERLALERRAG